MTAGPYSLSRHPLYCAVLAATLGLGVVLNSWWPLAALAPFLLWTAGVAVPREEAALAEAFGAQWEAYQRDTPRWLVCWHHRFWH